MREVYPEEEWVYTYNPNANTFTCNICGQEIPSTRKLGELLDPRGGIEKLDKHLWEGHHISFWNFEKGRPYKRSIGGNPTTSPGADKEELEVLKGLLPMVGICTGVIVVFAVAVRVFAMGRAVSQDGQYLVSVRYPGQWHDVREFVQPDNPDVLAVLSQVGADPWALYDFVCRNINYRRDFGEFWSTPSETLRGYGDCEDSANLLTSLLIAARMPAYTVLGNYQGYGHAWCEYNGQVMETTYTSARPVPDPQDYCPYILFDNTRVLELWPGALGEVFELGRNEAAKLNLMAEAVA